MTYRTPKHPAAHRSAAALATIALLATACAEQGDDDDGGHIVPAEPSPVIISEKDGAVMVHIPPGEMLMGTSDEELSSFRQLFPLREPAAFEDERPQRVVYLDGFYIDIVEVTNAQYRRFLAESGYTPRAYLDRPPHNAPDLPAVVFVWEDAQAYVEWAGKRLPTEAEWEKAARGTDGRLWPWGDEWDQAKLSGNDGTGEVDGYTQTAPVGRFPQGRSPYGVLDMEIGRAHV